MYSVSVWIPPHLQLAGYSQAARKVGFQVGSKAVHPDYSYVDQSQWWLWAHWLHWHIVQRMTKADVK